MAVVFNVYFYFHLYFSQSKNALLLNCVCFFCPHKMAEDVNYCIKIKHFLPANVCLLNGPHRENWPSNDLYILTKKVPISTASQPVIKFLLDFKYSDPTLMHKIHIQV